MKIFIMLSFQLEMVKVTVKTLQRACKTQLNIIDQVKDLQVNPFADLRQFDQDEFFEVALGLIYSYTRTHREEFWLWAAKEKVAIAFAVIEGGPHGIFIRNFEGTAQWD